MNDIIKDLTQKVQEHKKKVEKLTITPKEFAEVLGIGTNKAYEILRSKDGPGTIKIGTRILIPIKSLDAWVERSMGKEF